MQTLADLLAELKRRRVFRVAVVYAGIAFIIVQIMDGTFEPMGIPDWVSRLIIILLALGFPIAVGLAWAFDITVKGVVRTAAKGREEAKAPPRPFIGNKTLAVVAAVAVAVAVWSYLSKGEQPGPINAIAVLPLENLMNDPDQDYFVDGMHEALISELGKISALRVISRTSAMHYKDTDKLLPEIARELNVDAVVEGSVLRVGDRVKITAQLVGTQPERHLWTDNYTRDLVDVLELHSEVARAIANEIKVTLTPEEEARLASTRQVDPKAHEAYLLGRHYYGTGLEPDLKRAIGYFERAIEIDSTYALAYAGLADAYVILGGYHILPPEDTWPKARAAAEKALAIDEGLAEAHTSLAMVKSWFEWDWPGAEREFKRALEINPNSSDALSWYADFLSAMERYDEALSQIERALELDPYSFNVKTFKAWILSHAGHKNEAIQLAKNEIDSDPDQVNPLWYWRLANFYAGQGRYEGALAPLRTQINLMEGDVSDELGYLGYLYGRLGRKAEALKQLEALDELAAKGRYVSPVTRSLVYIGLDDKDKAFACLDKGYQTHDGWMSWLKVSSSYDTLRDDPRFADLLRRMNFPE